MYYEVTEAALFMATAGFLDEGNQLLQCLWRFKWPHIEDCWLPDQAFEVLWHAKGERPLNVPFPKKPIAAIELAHRRYMTIDRCFQLPMPSGGIEALHGLDLMRRCHQLACPSEEEDSLPAFDLEREALSGLNRLIFESGDADAHHGGYNLVLAAELAARNGLTAQAIECAVLWAANYPERWLGCNFPTMASSRHVAPFLLKGIFAEPFGLTATSCQSYLKSLVTAVEARMKCGRKLWGPKTDPEAERAESVAGLDNHRQGGPSRLRRLHPPAGFLKAVRRPGTGQTVASERVMGEKFVECDFVPDRIRKERGQFQVTQFSVAPAEHVGVEVVEGKEGLDLVDAADPPEFRKVSGGTRFGHLIEEVCVASGGP
jgi:hypothetical protein